MLTGNGVASIRRPVRRRLLQNAIKLSPRTIKARLDALHIPQITSWEVKAGVDASGQRALWAWGTVASNNVNPNELLQVGQIARQAIAKSIDGDSPWVYVRFRDPEDQ